METKVVRTFGKQGTRVVINDAWDNVVAPSGVSKKAPVDSWLGLVSGNAKLKQEKENDLFGKPKGFDSKADNYLKGSKLPLSGKSTNKMSIADPEPVSKTSTKSKKTAAIKVDPFKPTLRKHDAVTKTPPMKKKATFFNTDDFFTSKPAHAVFDSPVLSPGGFSDYSVNESSLSDAATKSKNRRRSTSLTYSPSSSIAKDLATSPQIRTRLLDHMNMPEPSLSSTPIVLTKHASALPSTLFAQVPAPPAPVHLEQPPIASGFASEESSLPSPDHQAKITAQQRRMTKGRLNRRATLAVVKKPSITEHPVTEDDLAVRENDLGAHDSSMGHLPASALKYVSTTRRGAKKKVTTFKCNDSLDHEEWEAVAIALAESMDRSKLRESSGDISSSVSSETTTAAASDTSKASNVSTASGMSVGEFEVGSVAGLLKACHQEEPMSLADCFGKKGLKSAVKLGEGAYGEVFKALHEETGIEGAFKVVPVGGEVPINDGIPMSYAAMLPEIIISNRLASLAPPLGRHGKQITDGFIGILGITVCSGVYPKALLSAWDKYAKIKESENDRPDVFDEGQHYVVFAFANGGTDLEHCDIETFDEARSILAQAVTALSVAEKAFSFEHRDLHWGNILVKRTPAALLEAVPASAEAPVGTVRRGRKPKADSVSPPTVPVIVENVLPLAPRSSIRFCADGRWGTVETNGVKACIIDFTLSRMEVLRNRVLFYDLEADEIIFQGKGDPQFDVYRDMRKQCAGDWQQYLPKSNVLWLVYLADKICNEKLKGRAHTNNKKLLRAFMSRANECDSSAALLSDPLFADLVTFY